MNLAIIGNSYVLLVTYSSIMISTTVNLEDDFHKKVREYCNNEGYSYNKLIVKLLKDRLEINK